MSRSDGIEQSVGGATETRAMATNAVTADAALSRTNNNEGGEGGKNPATPTSVSTANQNQGPHQGPYPYNQYQFPVDAAPQHPVVVPSLRAITPPLVGSAVAPTTTSSGGFLPMNIGATFAQSPAVSVSALPQQVPSYGVSTTAAANAIAAHGQQAILPVQNPVLSATTQVVEPHNLVPTHLQHLLALGQVGGAPAIQGQYGGLVPAPNYTHNLIPPQLQAAPPAQVQHPQPALAALAAPLQQLQPALVALDASSQSALLQASIVGPTAAALAPLSLALGPLPPQPPPTLLSSLHAQQLLGPMPQSPPVPVPGSEHGMPTGPALCVQDLSPAVSPVFNGVNPSYPGLRVVNTDPPVFAVDDFVSAEECAFLIASACDSFGPAPVVGAGAGEISPSRTSSTCYLAREDLPGYLSKVSALTGKPIRHCELPQVGRYLPSQQYLQHFDAFDLSTEDGRRFASNGGQRTVTVLVYLNDVGVGGATSFPTLGIDVQPRKGTALVFFPATVDGYLDKRALHAAMPAVDIKYVSQVWIRQGDYDGLPSKRLGRDRDAAVREAARLTGGGGGQ